MRQNSSRSSSESTVGYREQSTECLRHFDSWNEQEQVTFVQEVLMRMCHYQHGLVNGFLRPMLQRDFISAFPGLYLLVCNSRAIYACYY